MADTNTTTEQGWFVKPTIDTITYFENLAASFYEEAKIMVDTTYVKLNWMDAKGQALNIIIPFTQAANGQKEWNEAIANGTGSVIQDLAVSALLTAGYVGVVAVATGATVATVTITAPVAALIGVTALGITWISSANNVGLGNVFEDAIRAYKSEGIDVVDYLKDYFFSHPEVSNSITPEEKQRLKDLGFIIFDPSAPNNPTHLNPSDGKPFALENFDPPRRDPLVLDLNKDGLISTVSLTDSTAFFDITGDGIKEKVGWVSATEGIVAFDKNGNGKIDGIGEVFGTATTSGFAELRTLADSNYDGVIDRRDELYNQLKVWQDVNQDGISQASELKTLAEAGVNNIELNVFATNINLNGNLLTEAGRYSDNTGTRSLAADIELTFDARITTVDTSLIPDYTIHPDAAALPKLRGYGTVYNSEIAYNINDNLRNLAISMSQDITAVAKNFDAFIAEWSGLNTLLRNAQEKYALTSAPILSEMDKKVWVYEHFMGNNRFSSGIESRINATASAMVNNQNFKKEKGVA